MLVGDVVPHRLARDAGDEAGQAGACAIGKVQHIDGRLDRARSDVDDAAEVRRQRQRSGAA